MYTQSTIQLLAHLVIYGTLQILLLVCSVSSLHAQEQIADNTFLYKISHEDLEDDSYLFGTIHMRDERVFNFDPAVYEKLLESKFFALEVHPDTLVQELCINPFNDLINNMFSDESLRRRDSLALVIKEETDVDVDELDIDDPLYMELALNNFFKKGKEKNVILDAHLYQIAKSHDKVISGLESIEDRRVAFNLKESTDTLSTDSDSTNRISRIIQEFRFKEQLIDTYIKGDLDQIEEKSASSSNASMVYRNDVMVNNSLQYIRNGGIFMAVGVGHLGGHKGMIKAYEDLGFEVTRVPSSENTSIDIEALINKEIPWVKNTFEVEGYEITTPEELYRYQPSNLAGIIMVGFYPDLGNGCMYYSLASPLLASEFDMDLLLEEMNLETRASKNEYKLLSKNIYEENGNDVLTLKFLSSGRHYLYFKYMHIDDYLYVLGFQSDVKGELEGESIKKFHDSFKVLEKKSQVKSYTSSALSYRIDAQNIPMTFSEIDDSEALIIKYQYDNFVDQKKQLYYIVVTTDYSPLSFMSNYEYAKNNHADSYITSPGDSLLLDTSYVESGISKILMYSDLEKTYVQSYLIPRGNRMHQVFIGGTEKKNVQKYGDEIYESFQFTDYAAVNSWTKFDKGAYTINFPNSVETGDDCYDLSYITDGILHTESSYASSDVNSTNYLVEIFELSEYVEIDHRDTLKQKLIEQFIGYQDTLTASSSFIDDTWSYFDFTVENADHFLQIHHRLIPQGNTLYKLTVRHDKELDNQVNTQSFFDSFTLKKPVSDQFINQTAEVVKSRIIRAIQSNDSLKIEQAIQHIDNIELSKEEGQDLLIALHHIQGATEYTYSSILTSIIDSNPALIEAVSSLYTDKATDDTKKMAILDVLITTKQPDAIRSASRLLSTSMVNPDNDWEFEYLFYPILDSIELAQYLIPDILTWANRDTSVLCENLLSSMMSNELIDINSLEKIKNSLTYDIKNVLNEISTNEDEYYTSKYSLLEKAQLASHFPLNDVYREAYDLLIKDTLTYYKGAGIAYLMRNDLDYNESDITALQQTNDGLRQLYSLEKEFNNYSLLPDSLHSYEEFAKIYSDAYMEDAEYGQAIDIQVAHFEQIDKTHNYYFISEMTYYEGDSFWVATYVSFDGDKNSFGIPDEEEINFDYYYMDDKDDTEALQKLKDLYVSGK